ncbi:MAG: radical SAM protein [Lachnospiraceae bacterium]|nr:radical SAM protein [Lachnospiraceae bacterium]
MSGNFRLDSHKLIYHPERVAKWLAGDNIYPIEVEISPSGSCNHRCVFCALDYLGYQPNFLKKDTILRAIYEMREHGLKSVVCAGEGEPLLNKDLVDIVNNMKSFGLDVAMSTNGVLFTKDISKECLRSFTWVRFSVSSMKEDTYESIQRGKKGDLNRLCENIQDAVKIKRDEGLRTTIGVQCLLMPENMGQVVSMAEELQKLGVDYFTIKPYMSHTLTHNAMDIDYSAIAEIEKELKQFESEEYKIYFRISAMNKMKKCKTYEKCNALPFMVHIDAKGTVWPCVELIGREEFCYGNIYENSFEKIWSGKQRQNVIERINKLDLNENCGEACRLDEMNRYLWELKNPSEHVNFI